VCRLCPGGELVVQLLSDFALRHGVLQAGRMVSNDNENLSAISATVSPFENATTIRASALLRPNCCLFDRMIHAL
jgi:hypothetical protein